MNDIIDPVKARYYSDGIDEKVVLRNRTVPLRGPMMVIAAVVVVGLLYNGVQKIRQSLKTTNAKQTIIQPEKVSSNVNAINFYTAKRMFENQER